MLKELRCMFEKLVLGWCQPISWPHFRQQCCHFSQVYHQFAPELQECVGRTFLDFPQATIGSSTLFFLFPNGTLLKESLENLLKYILQLYEECFFFLWGSLGEENLVIIGVFATHICLLFSTFQLFYNVLNSFPLIVFVSYVLMLIFLYSIFPLKFGSSFMSLVSIFPIIEFLWMTKGILKDHENVHIGIKGSLGSSIKKKNNNTTNKESLRKGMRKQAQGSLNLKPKLVQLLLKKKN